VCVHVCAFTHVQVEDEAGGVGAHCGGHGRDLLLLLLLLLLLFFLIIILILRERVKERECMCVFGGVMAEIGGYCCFKEIDLGVSG
jgi:hypothetical protein